VCVQYFQEAACLGFKHVSEACGTQGELAKGIAGVTALTDRPNQAALATSQHNGRERVTRGHTWHQLYQRQALVHVPYEMSTMSLFEQYSAGVPLVFPTKRFYVELIKKTLVVFGHFWKGQWVRHLKQPWSFLTAEEQSFWLQFKHTRRSDDSVFLEMGDPERQTPEELIPSLALDFWIDKADFYDSENMPGLFYYDSWDELQEMLTNGAISAIPLSRSLESRLLRVEKILDMWRPLLLSKFPLLKK